MAEAEFLKRYGPVALVTGASSGIGWAFAEELAARGFDLAVAARRTGNLDELAAKLKAEHGTATTVIEADLADPAGPAALLATTAGLDIGLVVSNAGFSMKGAHEAHDAAEMHSMLMVNCNAPLLLAHGFIPRLKARGRGGIVFTASIEGLMGCPYSTPYSASKALVIALGEGLWGEMQGTGIDILTVCPGATESEGSARYAAQYGPIPNLQPAREVAALTLDNIAEGPTYLPHPVYKAMFEQMTAMPRRDALNAMAAGLRGKV